MPSFYYVSRVIVRVLLSIIAHRQVIGKENIPQGGPLIIVANHLSLVDPPLLGASIDRKTMFMAKKELFHYRVVRHFVRSFGAFPVHRGRLDKQGLRQAYQVLDNGLALVMFPEGMRSRNGQLRNAFSGAAMIACHTGTPILPIGISGTEVFERPRWLWHRPRITVNIGQPFYLPAPRSRLTKQELAESTTSIMQHIAELVPPDYRGDYAT